MADKKSFFNWSWLRSATSSVGSLFWGKVVDAIFNKIVMPLLDWARSAIIVEKNKSKTKKIVEKLKKAEKIEDVSKDFRDLP